MITLWQKTYPRSPDSLHGSQNTIERQQGLLVFLQDRLSGFAMVNHTFNFAKALRGQKSSAEWYIKKADTYRRELVQSKIDEELSGCWRCSGKEQGLCDCCDHYAAVKELEKRLQL